MTEFKIKNTISNAFKMHGLSLRSEATKYLVEVLLPIREVECDNWLEKLIDTIQKQPLSCSLIQKSTCENAVQDCIRHQADDCESLLTVIDAFSTPKFCYQSNRKKFILDSSMKLSGPALYGLAADKASLFLDRYVVLHQRTLRHDLFTQPIIGSLPDEGTKKFQLKPVEYLIGSSGCLKDVVVLGMLTQLKEGKWYLEDPTGFVPLDLSQATFHTGLFTDSCFVLAEGWYDDAVFHVDAFGFPPAESAKTTRSHFGNLNFFGGLSATCAKSSLRLQHLEQENLDAMLVFVADVWLDDAKVLEKLRELFFGYSEFPPVAFILCGNFLSCPTSSRNMKAYHDGFQALANVIAEFKKLVDHSKFIFVPGPDDVGHATILPRPAIPNSMTEAIRHKLPSAIFTSNPCHIQYCTKEIVVLREDVVTKMCRNCVCFPPDGDIPSHFAKTVVSQAHLCPLPLHVSPVYWAYDYTLRLYPLPDLLVSSDKFDPFQRTSNDCIITNPGSFPRTEFSFKVYYPATNEVQDSKIPT